MLEWNVWSSSVGELHFWAMAHFLVAIVWLLKSIRGSVSSASDRMQQSLGTSAGSGRHGCGVHCERGAKRTNESKRLDSQRSSTRRHAQLGARHEQ